MGSPYQTTTAEADGSDAEAVATPLRASSKGRPSSASSRKKKNSFRQNVQAIATENPPTKDPVGYTSSILGLCCGCCGLCCFVLVLGLLNAVPIAIIAVGAIYFDREKYCPLENISMLLVIGGSVSLVQGLVETIVRAIGTWRRRHDPDYQTHNHPLIQIVNNILRLATLGWFIAACVIVYRNYSTVNFDDSAPDLSNYCHPILYWFSFWLVTASFIMLGIMLALLVCSCVCLLIVR